MFFYVPVGLEYLPVSFSIHRPRETKTTKERRIGKYTVRRVWIKCYYYSAIANLGIRGITENVRAGESPAYLSSPHVGHSVA